MRPGRTLSARLRGRGRHRADPLAVPSDAAIIDGLRQMQGEPIFPHAHPVTTDSRYRDHVTGQFRTNRPVTLPAAVASPLQHGDPVAGPPGG